MATFKLALRGRCPSPPAGVGHAHVHALRRIVRDGVGRREAPGTGPVHFEAQFLQSLRHAFGPLDRGARPRRPEVLLPISTLSSSFVLGWTRGVATPGPRVQLVGCIRGAATASSKGNLWSTRRLRICTMEATIRAPPAAPVTYASAPSSFRTMVGEIPEMGRDPGSAPRRVA